MNGIYGFMWRNGLVRSQEDSVLAGVCSGLGRRFGMDAWPMRWLFILVLIILPGSPILIYPLLWIFMPSEDWATRASAWGGQPAPGSTPNQPYDPYGGQPYSGQPYGGQQPADGQSNPGGGVQ